MRSKEKKFGILVVEADGAGSKEGKDASYGEDSVKRCAINVGILGNNRRPVEEAVSRDVMSLALHIDR